jgi:hypothetical protein
VDDGVEADKAVHGVAKVEAVGSAAAVGWQDKSRNKKKKRGEGRKHEERKRGEGGGRRTNPPPLGQPQ